MRIDQLVLKRFKPLMLSDIQSMTLDCQATMQLLLGTNGCGKTSVLRELNPYPGHHRQFFKGGEKTIRCEHRGWYYVLESQYTGGTGRHSFVRLPDATTSPTEDHELNPGGTVAVQRDLVQRYFQLSPETLAVLQGRQRFTEMPVNKRREWLTRLSPVDLRYAFQVYDACRRAHRDQQGVIKHINQRLSKEHQTTESDSQYQQYQDQVDRLTHHLNLLMTYRQRRNNPFTQTTPAQEQEQLIARMSSLLRTYPVLPSGVRADNSVEAQAALSEAVQRRDRTQATLDRMHDEYQRLETEQPQLTQEALQPERVKELQTARDQAIDELRQWDQQAPQVPTQLPDITTTLTDPQLLPTLEYCYQDWCQLVPYLIDNSDQHYSRQRLEAAQTRDVELGRVITQTNDQRLKAHQRLTRLKACETVYCPNCQHGFKPGADPQEVDQLEAKVTELDTALDQYEQERQHNQDYIEQVKEYLDGVRRFRRLTEAYPSFQPVWEWCVEQRAMTRSPQALLPEIQVWYAYHHWWLKRLACQQKADRLTEQCDYLASLDQDALVRTNEQLERLRGEIGELTATHQQLQTNVEAIDGAIATIQRWLAEADQAMDAYQGFQQRVNDAYQYQLHEAIDQAMRDNQQQLAQAQEALTQHKTKAAVIEDLERQHQQAQDDQQDYRRLVDALAPTNGVIGHYLMTFMTQVTRLLNGVINQIWTYPLAVCPSTIEKDELNYKFALDVNDGAVVAPDIVEGSEAQKEIINFAFVLLVMKYLDLGDMPLYLDELGNVFDEEHRQRLTQFLDQMVDNQQVPQLFFISHYATTHGAFVNSEVCVIDPANITTPAKYNQHVTFS